MGRELIANNINTVLKIFLKKIKCPLYIKVVNEIREHPSFPSFLSIQHALRNIDIDSVALKTNIDQLRDELPKPVLVHIVTNTDLFLLIDSVDEENVYIINEQLNNETLSIKDFRKIWDSNAMIFDLENINIKPITIHERFINLLSLIKRPFIYTTVISTIIFLLINHFEHRNIFNYLYLIFSSLGLLFSILLLIEHFDRNNPIIRQFCTSKKNPKINCSSILDSKDAYLLGIFSWSDIGIVFFSFLFLLNLFKSDGISITVTSIFSALAFPYVFYSVTYQKFIARSWCRLCLGVQCAILALFTTSIYAYHSIDFSVFNQPSNYLIILLSGMAIISALLILKPLLNALFEVRGIKPKYTQLKHTPEVIQTLLGEQKTIGSASNYALRFGNSKGEITLTLILNPTCNPCMNELGALLPILRRKENTNVELIFLVDKEDIQSKTLAEALIDKYLSNGVDYMDVLEDYVNNYPKSKYGYTKEILHNTIYGQSQRILEGQQQWGKENRVYSTPQIFLNNMRLLEYYTPKDIDYMCS